MSAFSFLSLDQRIYKSELITAVINKIGTKKNRMKMKRILVFVLMFLNVAFAMADVYTDGLRKLLNSNAMEFIVSSEKLKMLWAADPLGGCLGEEPLNAVVDFAAPYYRDNMTEKEFLQMVDFMMKPEYSAIGIKVTKMSIVNGYLIQDLKSVAKTLERGEKPADVQLKSCSPTMKEKIEWIYNEMDVDRTISVSIEQMRNFIEPQVANVPADRKEQVAKMFNGMMDYWKNNYRTIMMNNYIDAVTEQELDVVLSITKEPFYPSYKKACTAMANGLTQIIKNMRNNGAGK